MAGVGKPNYNLSVESVLYLTEAPEPHYTVCHKACKEGWFIYEVVAQGQVNTSSCWDEYWTEFPCEIVRVVGNARGIARAGRASRTEDEMREEQAIRDRIVALKALTPEEAVAVLEEYNCNSINDIIRTCQTMLAYRNAKTSKAPRYRFFP